MKRILQYLVIGLSCLQCTEKSGKVDLAEEKSTFEEGEHIKVSRVDYTQTPINKKVQKHPELYDHLDQVDFFRIAYLSDSLLITGLMVAPKADGNYPVIVYNRGGNRDLGRLLMAISVDVLSKFAAEGYVVVASNYRGNSSSEGTEEFGGSDVNDVVNLIKILPEVSKANAEKVGLLGLSRGGMMSYLTLKRGTLPQVKAAAVIGGITDLEITAKHHPQMTEVYSDLIPGIVDDKLKVLRERSARYWTNLLPKDVPLLIMHSKSDEHVNYEQIPMFLDSLSTHNVPHESVIYENDTHGLTNNQEEVFRIITHWFNNYLK